MDGGVIVDGQKVTKPGTLIKDGAKIQVTTAWQPQKYVSRGGLKLEKALQEFNLKVSGLVCLDVGASTGGFTDCLLQAGAAYVYAVDVGHGQLDWSLRIDQRVAVIEKTNARKLSKELLKSQSEQGEIQFAVIDVSFISLKKILPAVQSCLSKSAQIVALIKPQFEAGPEYVGKGGVVKSAALHKKLIGEVLHFAEQIGLHARALTFSPLKGPQGNIEFLVWLDTAGEGIVDEATISNVVDAAHGSL